MSLGDQTATNRPARVFLLDLWATVPYYTAYLAKALQAEGASVQVGSMTYYLDRTCFTARGLRTDPGVLDVVGRLRLPRILRRGLKFAEGLVNLCALTLRFLFRPPDVVHVQFLPMLRSRFPMDRWFVRFCQWRGIPVVLTVHDLLPHDTGAQHQAMYQHLYETVDALICHSVHIRARLEAEFDVPDRKISVIPHGPFFFDLNGGELTSTRGQLGVAPGQHMVLWQGILLPYKGVDLLLQAWHEVEGLSEDMCLVVLGTGEPALVASLEAQARELELCHVRFHPRFCSPEELVSAYRAAEIVVYPYRAITTSGALATGLSLGKAIVASRLPVFEELLTDGKDAVLVDPEDRTELADALVGLIRDEKRRNRFEAEVRKLQFGQQAWRTIATDTLGLYRRVQRHATGLFKAQNKRAEVPAKGMAPEP